MTLRQKLLLPLFLISLLMGVYIKFVWIPHSLQQAEQNYLTITTHHLDNVAEDMIPPLLGNQLDIIYENLAALKKKNPGWVDVRLISPSGRTIYPLAAAGAVAPTGDNLHRIEIPVDYIDMHLGKLIVMVDITPALDKLRTQNNELALLLFSMLGIMFLTILLVLELAVRKPLTSLTSAARKLAAADYDALLPHASRDEVGTLVGSFAFMRNELLKWKLELLQEHSRLQEQINERMLVEKELLKNEHFLDSVIEHIPNMLFVKDAKNLNFLRFNKAGEKLLGYSRDELIGKSDYDLFPKEQADFFASKDRNIIDSREFLDIAEEPITTRFLGTRYLHTKKIPIFDDDGRPLYLLGISEDITERKQAEERIKELNRDLEQRVIDRTAQLEAANKELEAFSYSVSHDLRSPLRAIDGFSRILLDEYTDKLDDEGKRLLNVVRDNTSRMGQLIDDILQFSRTGRLELSFSEIDMEKLAREVFEEIQPSVDHSKLQLEIEAIPVFTGDRAMMRQVFVNLLSNAIKFSCAREPARIKVGGSIEGDEAIYYVKDNGAGFDMHYADKLFGVFQRLHSVNEFEGTGIGLAIVKRIITRHGGRVWAEGKVDEGATIYFALPVIAARHE